MRRLDIVKELASMRDLVLLDLKNDLDIQGNLLVRINKIIYMVNESEGSDEQGGQKKRTEG